MSADFKLLWTDPKFGEQVEIEASRECDPWADELQDEAPEESERLGLMLCMDFAGTPADLMRLATDVANWVTEDNLTAQGDTTIRRDCGNLEEMGP